MKPYEELATIYDSYQIVFTRLYYSLIKKLCSTRNVNLSAVLDLGCGTGSLVRRLSPICDYIIGVDVSHDMLSVARSKSSDEFLHGDFRNFELNKTFSLVVSGFDSLNYVRSVDELEAVFGCVARHLEKKQGVFVFDVVNENHFLALHNRITTGTYKSENGEVVSYSNEIIYDPQIKRMTSKFVFKDDIEIHNQIPLERNDIVRCAERSGLFVADVFSDFSLSTYDNKSGRHIYIVSHGPMIK